MNNKMLNGLYGYLFGSEGANNDNNTKENVDALKSSTELIACTPPDEISETKDDDWVVIDGPPSGRSTPVLVSEPDLTPIDDDLSTLETESLRPTSPASSPPRVAIYRVPKSVSRTCIYASGQEPCNNDNSVNRSELVYQVKQKVFERKELERQLFKNEVLGLTDEEDKKQFNHFNNNSTNNKTLNMLNNASKMKRLTAAGHFAADSKTKPRSKKTSRLHAGRNNDRKVNNLN